jgi:hypothetical protein
VLADPVVELATGVLAGARCGLRWPCVWRKRCLTARLGTMLARWVRYEQAQQAKATQVR